MELTVCPNCNRKMSAFMSSYTFLDPFKTEFINRFHEPKSEAYCNNSNCGDQLFFDYGEKLKQTRKYLNSKLEELIEIIPIITSNNPVGWDYSILSMVTSQSVTGTGIYSELASSFSDFFGSQSNALGNKLEAGEKICMNILRLKAIKLGGNAIISTDIDYEEVGGGKAMLMVCMAGTAIKVKEIGNLFEQNKDKFQELVDTIDKLNHINSIASFREN